MLSKNDLNYVDPYLDKVSVTPEQNAFLGQSRREVNRKEQRRRLIILSVVVVMAVLTALALIQGAKARASAEKTQQALDQVLTEQAARLWDADTRQEQVVFRGHTSTVWSADFSPDGALIVTDSEMTGQEQLRLSAEQGRVSQARFLPDGRRIVTAAGNAITFWDANSGRELLTLRGHTQEVTWLDVSSDGQRLVSVSDDQTVQVWNVSGQALFSLRGLTAKVQTARFSPDGTQLATTSEDGTVQLWDSASGDRLLAIDPDGFRPLDVFFHPTLPQLISVENNRVRTWWINLPALLEEAAQAMPLDFLPAAAIDAFDLEPFSRMPTSRRHN